MIWDAWVILGFVAQAMFTARFAVQWIASERRRQSYIPEAFWYFSLCGGLLLFVYALNRRDPVFILGQGAGVFIYLRNIHFIRKHKSTAKLEAVDDGDTDGHRGQACDGDTIVRTRGQKVDSDN